MVPQLARNCDLTPSAGAAEEQPQRLFHLHRPTNEVQPGAGRKGKLQKVDFASD